MDWCLISKHKSWLLYWLFIIFLMSPTFMVQPAQGVNCIEEERNPLLELKASLQLDTYDLYWSYILPTWVDHSTSSGGECCEWERVKCDSTSGHVTHLSLTNILLLPDGESKTYQYFRTSWLLNFSIFLHFEELTSLDLSYNNIGVSKGFEMLSSLKKLELLNLSHNSIENDFFPSLSSLTSLKILDLGYNGGSRNHDILEFAALENLEVLDITRCGYYGTFQMQGSQKDTILKKLKILNLGLNIFNASLITSLYSHPSLKALDLSFNELSGSFPAEELAGLTKLEKLDLSSHYDLNVTPSIQDCQSLLRMKRLETLTLRGNVFNKSIISCLSFLPSLNTLDLRISFGLMGGSFPMQELSTIKGLKTLDMSYCGFQSPMLNGYVAKFNLFSDFVLFQLQVPF